MTEGPGPELRRDAFLGGRLRLWQPVRGYRAGIDPVLLAASVPAQQGERVLDLGCGAGAAALCLGCRVPGLTLLGIERVTEYADLARRNAAQAGLTFDVTTGDLSDPPESLRGMVVDHVLANPPYYDRTRGSRAPDDLREAALGTDTPLIDWSRAAARWLRPKGYLHMILQTPRLGEALSALGAAGLGSIQIQPLAAREGRSPKLLLIRARKNGRAALTLKAPILLHAGGEHPGDREHYTDRIQAVLRCGASLEFLVE